MSFRLFTKGLYGLNEGLICLFHLTGRLMVFLFESGQPMNGNKEGEQGSTEVV